MEACGIIMLILWATLSMTVIIEYAPSCKNLKAWEWIVVGLIFIFGGPIFAIANILEAILDCILPAGWSDDGPS